jgi:hypothetical protein
MYSYEDGSELPAQNVASWSLTTVREGMEAPDYWLVNNIGSYTVEKGDDGNYISNSEQFRFGPSDSEEAARHLESVHGLINEADADLILQRDVAINYLYNSTGMELDVPIPVPFGFEINGLELRDAQTGNSLDVHDDSVFLTSPSPVSGSPNGLQIDKDGAGFLGLTFANSRAARPVTITVSYREASATPAFTARRTRLEVGDDQFINPDTIPGPFNPADYGQIGYIPEYFHALQTRDWAEITGLIRQQDNLSENEAMIVALTGDLIDRVHLVYKPEEGDRDFTPGDLHLIGSDRQGRIVDIVDQLSATPKPEEGRPGGDFPLGEVLTASVAIAAAVYVGRRLKTPTQGVAHAISRQHTRLRQGLLHRTITKHEAELAAAHAMVSARQFAPQATIQHSVASSFVPPIKDTLAFLGRTLNTQRAVNGNATKDEAALLARQFAPNDIRTQRRLRNLFEIAMNLDESA